MKYTRFGKTEIQMPLFSAGCMRTMQSWHDAPSNEIGKASQKNFEAVVAEALRLGINHFETARGYGSSERQLGYILPALKRDTIIVQTKVKPERDPEVFVSNVLDSLWRLQVEYVDLLAFHGVNSYRELWYICRPHGCLAAARALQRQGQVGFVGFSGHGPTDVILDAIEQEQEGGFDYVNLHWYTIFQQHTEALREARRRDLGVFIISPTDKGGMLYKPPERLKALSLPLTPLQFNDLFCLSQPEVHTLSIGASVPADYHDHVEALAYLDDTPLIACIYGRWQEAMQKATGQANPDAHWQRYPSFENIPGFIHISFIFWLENLAKGWGLLEYAQERYALLARETQWVPGNNAAQVESYELSEIALAAQVPVDELVLHLQGAHRLLSK
jgi:predicted aldo/keto reductase-like oxidoreductase